jgi:hypothetical protein
MFPPHEKGRGQAPVYPCAPSYERAIGRYSGHAALVSSTDSDEEDLGERPDHLLYYQMRVTGAGSLPASAASSSSCPLASTAEPAGPRTGSHGGGGNESADDDDYDDDNDDSPVPRLKVYDSDEDSLVFPGWRHFVPPFEADAHGSPFLRELALLCEEGQREMGVLQAELAATEDLCDQLVEYMGEAPGTLSAQRAFEILQILREEFTRSSAAYAKVVRAAEATQARALPPCVAFPGDEVGTPFGIGVMEARRKSDGMYLV